jgi:hypothetical protein
MNGIRHTLVSLTLLVCACGGSTASDSGFPAAGGSGAAMNGGAGGTGGAQASGGAFATGGAGAQSGGSGGFAGVTTAIPDGSADAETSNVTVDGGTDAAVGANADAPVDSPTNADAPPDVPTGPARMCHVDPSAEMTLRYGCVSRSAWASLGVAANCQTGTPAAFPCDTPCSVTVTPLATQTCPTGTRCLDAIDYIRSHGYSFDAGNVCVPDTDAAPVDGAAGE